MDDFNMLAIGMVLGFSLALIFGMLFYIAWGQIIPMMINLAISIIVLVLFVAMVRKHNQKEVQQ